jgi:hypothetical protein
MKIIEVNHGIANNFGSHIEVNKHLKEYPELFNSVLKHELSHTDKKFSLHDFKLDFTHDSKISNFQMLKFILKHPASLTQLLPIYYTPKKGFVYDINLIVMYLIMSSIFILTIYFGGKYL